MRPEQPASRKKSASLPVASERLSPIAPTRGYLPPQRAGPLARVCWCRVSRRRDNSTWAPEEECFSSQVPSEGCAYQVDGSPRGDWTRPVKSPRSGEYPAASPAQPGPQRGPLLLGALCALASSLPEQERLLISVGSLQATRMARPIPARASARSPGSRRVLSTSKRRGSLAAPQCRRT